MHIYYPHSETNEQSIDWYQCKTTIQKSQIHTPVEDLLFQYHDDPDRVFLLHEENFELIRCPIEGMIYEPLTLEQLNNLVAVKLDEIKKEHQIKGLLLLYDVDHITCDGEPSYYLLGQQGYLKWDIFFIFIKPRLALSCPNYENTNKQLSIYPASYFTVQFITKQLAIPSFSIISIQEQAIRLILIKDGFYHAIETLDRGIEHLKQIFISNNVINHFHHTDDELALNGFVSGILQENIDFYLNVIFKRLREFNQGITSCLINHPVFHNSLFMERFIAGYQAQIGGYIIPATQHQFGKSGDRKRASNELDILTCLEYIHSKEMIGS